MKTITFLILLIFSSMLINAQDIIDYKNFDEKKLDLILLNAMDGYNKTEYPINQDEIYTLFKKKSGELSLFEISYELNHKILKNYDTDSLYCFGITSSVLCENIITYQEIVERCLIDWQNPSDEFFLELGIRNILLTSYYNRKTNMVYIACVFR